LAVVVVPVAAAVAGLVVVVVPVVVDGRLVEGLVVVDWGPEVEPVGPGGGTVGVPGKPGEGP
jgi:hypothetical protein